MKSFIFKWYFVSELYQAKVLMVFAHDLLSAENEWAFAYIDNSVLFKNLENFFLVDIMTRNHHKLERDPLKQKKNINVSLKLSSELVRNICMLAQYLKFSGKLKSFERIFLLFMLMIISS